MIDKLERCYDIADHLHLKIERPSREDRLTCELDLLPPPEYVLKDRHPTHVLGYYENDETLLETMMSRLAMYEKKDLIEIQDDKYLGCLLGYAEDMCEVQDEDKRDINDVVDDLLDNIRNRYNLYM